MIWTLKQQRRYDPHGNGPQNHPAARRAVRHVRRHANEFHGAGVDDATRDLIILTGEVHRAGVAAEMVGSLVSGIREGLSRLDLFEGRPEADS